MFEKLTGKEENLALRKGCDKKTMQIVARI